MIVFFCIFCPECNFFPDKGMSESLAGRVSVMELSTLSLREIKGIAFNRHFVPSAEYPEKRNCPQGS